MRLRFYKHDVDFVDLELGGDGMGMGMKFITVSFSNSHARCTCLPTGQGGCERIGLCVDDRHFML